MKPHEKEALRLIDVLLKDYALGDKSKNQIAEAAGITYPTLNNVYNLKRNPSLDVFLRVAEAQGFEIQITKRK